MDRKVFRSIENKVKEIENEWGSLEDYAVSFTLSGEEHMMRMEEDFSSFRPEMRRVYQELYGLELADLMDLSNLSGRFNGDFI